MKKIKLIQTIYGLSMLFAGCDTVQRLHTTQRTYVDTQKHSAVDTTISFTLPSVKPAAKTTHSVTKGGVTISTEIIPFTLERLNKESRTITYADPGKPGYDVYEVANTPHYKVTPEDINFKIRIRNNESVPLKLSEIGFALIVDGTQWSFPTGYLDDWNKGIILTGFEKDYLVKGPQLAGLNNAKVVYIFLNGVPTEYDQAGVVKKKDNFEWYFECRSEQIQKQDQINYTYQTEPIHKEHCQACNGKGLFENKVTCSTCSGKGSYVNSKDGKKYQCYSCKGSGAVVRSHTCTTCSGAGMISYPKSEPALVSSSIDWSGWKVNVVTDPPGAKISVVDTKTGEYKSTGVSNIDVNWYTSSMNSYPIILEYKSEKVKILPYSTDGKPSSKIVVDFYGGRASVIKGKRVD